MSSIAPHRFPYPPDPTPPPTPHTELRVVLDHAQTTVSEPGSCTVVLAALQPLQGAEGGPGAPQRQLLQVGVGGEHDERMWAHCATGSGQQIINMNASLGVHACWHTRRPQTAYRLPALQPTCLARRPGVLCPHDVCVLLGLCCVSRWPAWVTAHCGC